MCDRSQKIDHTIKHNTVLDFNRVKHENVIDNGFIFLMHTYKEKNKYNYCYISHVQYFIDPNRSHRKKRLIILGSSNVLKV